MSRNKREGKYFAKIRGTYGRFKLMEALEDWFFSQHPEYCVVKSNCTNCGENHG